MARPFFASLRRSDALEKDNDMLRHIHSPRFRPTLYVLVALVAGSSLFARSVTAAEENKAVEPSGAETAILKSIATYVDAYNRGDAKAVAEHWSDTGEWMSPSGERRVGKAAIEQGLQEMFVERAGTTIEVRGPNVRVISEGVAVERGAVVVRTPGEESERSTYVALHVKRGDDWKLDSVYETAATEDVVSDSSYDDLQWLVGEWTDSSPEANIGAQIFWLKNKSFLNYSFHVSAPGADDFDGTQIVGRDPATGAVRSWMFDSDGGRGEGVWTKNGNSWVVKLTQTLPDGRSASSTNVYTRLNDDTILWKSIGRKVDGEFLPNIDDVKLVRKPAASDEPTGAQSLSTVAK